MSARPSSPPLTAAIRIAPWIGIVLLVAWTATPHPSWLALATAALLPPLIVRPHARSGRSTQIALLTALAAVPLGLLAHHRVALVASDFEAYWEAREARVFQDLGEALDDLMDRGDTAVAALARAADAAGGAPPADALRAIRRASGLAAAATYGPPEAGGPDAGPATDLWVWDGVHRGRVPEPVQVGARAYMFAERPLFSYLYFTRPVPATGGTAVVAALLGADLPEGLQAPPQDLASIVSRRSGETIRVGRPRGPTAPASFDFVYGPDTLFSVSVVRPTPAARTGRIETTWIRAMVVLVLVAWLLLAVAERGGDAHARRAAVTLLTVVALVPLDRLPGPGVLVGAGPFVPPGPVTPTLGRLLALGAAALAVSPLLWRVRPPGRRWVPLAVMGVAFPALAAFLRAAASTSLLAGPESAWVTWQVALGLVLALVAAGVLTWAAGELEEQGGWPFRGAPQVAAALGLALLFAAAGGAWVRYNVDLPVAFPALWTLAALPALGGIAAWRGWRRSLLLWVLAAMLGGSAALPAAWSARIDARISVAESRMALLGARVDPYLRFLLLRLARESTALDAEGVEPLELLYRGWVDSGMAQEGYPVWLTLHGPGGFPLEELRLGVPRDQPSVAGGFFEQARGVDTVQVRRLQRADAHYVATVPLSGGQVLTAVVPPVRQLAPVSSMGPLFDRLGDASTDPLTLVPLPAGGADDRGDGVSWVRSPEGWLGETLLDFPEERFRARYLVDLAGPLLLTARATLLLVLTLALVVALWAAGRVVFLGARPVGSEWKPLVTSFRARVTLALFGFFLLSIAIFGTLAYRTISGAAERAARVLAERVVADAAGFYWELGGRMELLARQVGGDLLEYRRGELREGSTEELVELGLYEGWVPWDVWRVISSRENVLATREQTLGRWTYLVAYRLLPDGDVLGAPVPQEAGATAVRRREVAHLLGFAVLAGALLSLVLALLVARTLTSPIHTLQVASERVGAGNLGVRLPGDRADEFGSVFVAFNRMVRRLRRARRDLVRTTRRTQAIVEDAATGVVALDASARVTLANPRAERLLGVEVDVGRRLRETGSPADELVRWVQLYFRDGLREAGTEFQFGDRRVRVRARRISREGPLGGAVLSLEDVTDELRAERILAWGEMARQVAHEVKNPLTPIKLSIQHIRRAWEDRRPDFASILGRNAEAALGEIDRLAMIASSFSRFGAPEVADEGPLEPVDLHAVVGEVLALYRSGEGAIRFEMDIPVTLPRVAARSTEVKEVLVNLLENARSAIEVDGRVSVSAETTSGAVLLRVSDDGSGIAEELLPRVFEPHFSTRSAGTGLGLAIVKRLVESWGAAVTVESRVGRGTAVELRLRTWEDAGPVPGVGGAKDGTGPASPDTTT